jgi:hypothetical protein
VSAVSPINFLGSIVSHVSRLRDSFVAAGVGRFVALERTGLPDQPWHIVSTVERGPRSVFVSGDPDVAFDGLRTAALVVTAALVSEAPAPKGDS